MTQRGTHTWDLTLHYHQCPNCSFIIESRDNFRYQSGKYTKELKCPRCQHTFTLEKKTRYRFGPLLGQPEKPEFDWEE